MERKTFSDLLKTLQGDLSKNAFAKKCGIPYTTMNSYLSGNSEPDVSNLLKIANANDTSVGNLLNEGDGKSIENKESPVNMGDGTMVVNKDGQAVGDVGDGGVVVQIPEGYQAKIIRDQEPSGYVVSLLTEKEIVFWEKFRKHGSQTLLDGFIKKLDQMRDVAKGE